MRSKTGIKPSVKNHSSVKPVKVILLNDGTKIKTMPDGSKLKIMPDGRKFKMKAPPSPVQKQNNASTHSSKPVDVVKKEVTSPVKIKEEARLPTKHINKEPSPVKPVKKESLRDEEDDEEDYVPLSKNIGNPVNSEHSESRRSVKRPHYAEDDEDEDDDDGDVPLSERYVPLYKSSSKKRSYKESDEDHEQDHEEDDLSLFARPGPSRSETVAEEHEDDYASSVQSEDMEDVPLRKFTHPKASTSRSRTPLPRSSTVTQSDLNEALLQVLSRVDTLGQRAALTGQRKIIHDFVCLLEELMQNIPEESWHRFQLVCLDLVERFRQPANLYWPTEQPSPSW